MNVLITGVTGFIGGHLCQRLLTAPQHAVTALVRPQTQKERYARFEPAVRIVAAELTDAASMQQLFARQQFDWVFHLAAIRGGGAAAPAEFERVNITAPLILAKAALAAGAKFLFCSSAGVFGTIPAQLPPTEATPRNGDNYYHYTKIEAEKQLRDLQARGLQLIILRPLITYGIGDRGFPFMLLKLIDRGLLFLPRQDLRIHLVDVRTVAEAFLRAAQTPAAIGQAYLLTDRAPVALHTFVHHISRRLRGKPYPAWKMLPLPFLRLAEFGFGQMPKSDAWLTRVRLMSRDWYYDGSLAAKELQLELPETIPNFDYVLDWYRQVKLQRNG